MRKIGAVNIRVDENRTALRKLFEDYLVEEWWYTRTAAENSDDWREERTLAQYTIYEWKQVA